MRRRRPGSPLFPYTTLFRSESDRVRERYGRDTWGQSALLARRLVEAAREQGALDRKSTRLNSSHPSISYAVFCLKKKKTHDNAWQSRERNGDAALTAAARYP